jgi:hypothetical protein
MKPIRSFARLLPLIGLFALPWAALAAPPITVGDGTASSCTQAALEYALAVAGGGGGIVHFKCGGGSVTISLTAPLAVPNNTTIDGGGAVTLVGDLHQNFPGLVLVGRDATAVLKNLSIGAAFFTPGVFNEGTLSVKNSTLSHMFGGGITNEGTLTVTTSTFSENDASGIINAGTLTVNNSMFSRNRGGIVNFGELTVQDSTFTDNVGENFGGILNGGTLTVTNSTFSSNYGQAAGGILSGGTLIVNNSMFSGNGNACCGGGITIGGGNLGVTAIVRNSAFFDNPGHRGGGVQVQEGSALTIYNSVFSGNSAAVGGGIYNEGTLTVINSTITQNIAQEAGGIYTCCGGTLTLENTSVTGNTPDDVVP